MKELDSTMMRYLLGDLPEAEKAALEENYFNDPQVFEQVVQVENQLLDAYVRGQLTQSIRNRLEAHYLADPGRRERLKFARTFVGTLDQVNSSGLVAVSTTAEQSWWHSLIPSWPARQWAMASFVAAASLLILFGFFWLLSTNRRLRRELQAAEAQRSSEIQRKNELAQQIIDEQKRADQLATELERVRTQAKPQETPASPAAPAVVSLILTVGGFRGSDSGAPPKLVIPAGTKQARLQLNLREPNYRSYQVVVQSVGGVEVLNRQGLQPRATSSGNALVLMVNTSQLVSGDYVLTLRGRADGELDDLSKSLFRVEKN
jgi:hypothetical protein